jgi:hypothetical protein
MTAGGLVAGGAFGIAGLISGDLIVAAMSDDAKDRMEIADCADQLPESETQEVKQVPEACEDFQEAYDVELTLRGSIEGTSETFKLHKQEDFRSAAYEALDRKKNQQNNIIIGLGLTGFLGGFVVGAVLVRPRKRQGELVPLADLFEE